MVIKIAQKTENFYKEKASQFECGFNPMTPSHTPFSFQFFLVAVLFLIFDVEIRIILAYPLEVKTATNTTLVILFLLGVLAGLAHE
jgi:NADH-ubiquinone oxidoreductase chain 3